MVGILTLNEILKDLLFNSYEVYVIDRNEGTVHFIDRSQMIYRNSTVYGAVTPFALIKEVPNPFEIQGILYGIISNKEPEGVLWGLSLFEPL
jgi:hypothetical protein